MIIWVNKKESTSVEPPNYAQFFLVSVESRGFMPLRHNFLTWHVIYVSRTTLVTRLDIPVSRFTFQIRTISHGRSRKQVHVYGLSDTCSKAATAATAYYFHHWLFEINCNLSTFFKSKQSHSKLMSFSWNRYWLVYVTSIFFTPISPFVSTK